MLFPIYPSLSELLIVYLRRLVPSEWCHDVFINHFHLLKFSNLFNSKLFILQRITPHFMLLGYKQHLLFICQMSSANFSVILPPSSLYSIPFSEPISLAYFHFPPEDYRRHQIRSVLRLILQKFHIWVSEFLAVQIKTNLKAYQKLHGEQGWKCIIQGSR